MARTLRRPVEDFASIFKALSQQSESVILVGGHAVNVWALSYRDRLGDVLAPLRPFTSADMDVYATRNALMALHTELGGRLMLSGPREVTDGTLIIGVEPDTREVDVLRSVYGLPRLDAQSAISLEICGHAVPVLFPHLLLQAKLENVLHLDQSGRQDLKHVRIMALVLREFLRDVVSSATSENEKYALNLLQRVQAILTSKSAPEVSRIHRVDFGDILPRELLTSSPLRKLANFGRKGLAFDAPRRARRRKL